MILTSEKIKELKEKKEKAEAAAKKTFEEKLFPDTSNDLSTFIDQRVVNRLLVGFEDECKNAESNGYFTVPQIRVRIIHDNCQWAIRIATECTNSEKSDEEEIRYRISGKIFPSASDIKRLMESACQKVGTRFLTADVDSDSMIIGYIEIDVR